MKLRFPKTLSVSILSCLVLGQFVVTPTAQAVTPAACSSLVSNTEGFWGSYYNLSNTDPGMFTANPGAQANSVIGPQNPWYSSAYLAFERVDKKVISSNYFFPAFPVSSGLPGDPYHYAISWRSYFTLPQAASVNFTTSSNQDSWVIVDGVTVVNNGGLHDNVSVTGTIGLASGTHVVEVYVVNRTPSKSLFSFNYKGIQKFYALPTSCLKPGSTGSSGGGTTGSGTGSYPPGRVLGDQTSQTGIYTPAVALYRAAGTPDIYAIYANGRKHHISGPAAFEKYGYKYSQVKTVTLAELDSHPDTVLVRVPESSLVYFLSARGNRQWLKIPLASPTVFASYGQNFWGDIAVIDQLDLQAYQNVKLVKLANESTIYLIKNNQHFEFINQEVLLNLGYNPQEAIVITPTHLNSFSEGEPIG